MCNSESTLQKFSRRIHMRSEMVNSYSITVVAFADKFNHV